MSSPLPLNIVLFLPFLVAVVILCLHKHLKGASVILSIASATTCFICSAAMLGNVSNIYPLLEFIHIDKVFDANIDAVVDKQSLGMLFIVTFIGMLVHWFSLGYMKDDEAQPRYFGALSLFMFSMTGIVLAANLFMMFIFWELVGLSSFLLIGHWFHKNSAAEAANKAFLTNRIGDFGFMIGILLLFGASSSVSFVDLKESLESGNLHAFAATHPTFMTIAALGLFLGAVGKSAQMPLHVWLPDAMEGPTPVSALIHAATMVAAGVYMLVRVSFIIAASPLACEIIAGVGAVTALMAALMATQQNDIKRVLAYSTLSQLGYMVMAVGIFAMEPAHAGHTDTIGHPGMFHLYTHAFFKALLFLGSGAVIYACHHEQDIWKMGGLRKYMPVTFWTFAIGTAALMGVPFLSGFTSKEEILGIAYGECKWLFIIGVVTAALTAFYMTRLVVVAFFGKARGEGAKHASEVPLIMLVPLAVLAIMSLISATDFVSGALQALKPLEVHQEGHMVVMVSSLIALVVGAGGGFFLYRNRDSDPISIKLFANKFYFDEIYAVLIKYAQDRFAWLVTGLERIFADGLIARFPTAIAARFGSSLRILQSGKLQAYTFLLGAGVLFVIYILVFVLPAPGH